MPNKEHIRQMFGQIASDYDKLNHIMSLDVDKNWRRRAIRRLLEPASCDPAEGLHILDLACGTGDFALAMARADGGCRVTGVDLTEEMLAVMDRKVKDAGLQGRIAMETGDGEALRFADGTFDRVAIAFGIRNFEDKEKGLREMLRVLKPGGRLVILELSEPENGLMRACYNLYFLHILPWIGGAVSGSKSAYRYLPASVVKFPKKQAFMQMMGDAGFTHITHKAFTFGICRMYTGEKA